MHRLLCSIVGLSILFPIVAFAQVKETIIVTAPAAAHDRDDTIVISSSDIFRAGRPDMLSALQRVPGISFSEAQSNPFQPNLVYRGFVVSPLQGNAQGLAVYLDGGRFNQPFGDTVDFDLLPDAAIRSIALKDAGPAYGLNALGGAIVVETKTGHDVPGLSLSGIGGRYGAAEGTIEAGWTDDGASAYVALQERHDSGWRRHSPSALYNGLADFGWDGMQGGVHLKLIGTDSNLTGNGSAPIELLAADRRAVFTHPDRTRNRFERASLHPWMAFSDTTRIEASLYLQRLRQRTLNGDAADIEACENEERADLLCLESTDDDDHAATLTDGQGAAIPHDGLEDFGVLNRSQTRSLAGGLLLQLVDKRSILAGDNDLILGLSYDRSRTHFRSSTELGILTEERSVDGLGPIIDQEDNSISPVSLTTHTRYIGLFVSDELPLTRRLTVQIGLRYNHASIRLNDRIGTALTGDHSFGRINPGLELNYRDGRGIMLRAGYSETNRAPTPAELSCAGPEAPCSLTNFFVADPPLKQVVARTWEAGASGEHKGPWEIRWLLSSWRATNSNDIQFIAADVRGRAYFANIGKTRRQGIEGQLDIVRGPWSLRLGYAYIDATFRNALTLNSVDNPAAEDGVIMVKKGNRLPGLPTHRGTLSLDYADKRFSFGFDLQAQSGTVLFGDEANQQPRTASFAVIDVRGGLRLAGEVWLFGEVTNILNKHYATFGTFSETAEVEMNEVPDASNPRSVSPGEPRRWLLGLRVRL